MTKRNMEVLDLDSMPRSTANYWRAKIDRAYTLCAWAAWQRARIEQVIPTMDAVWFIHRPEYFEARKERRREHEISEAKIVVRKGRGTEGSGEVSLWFQKKNTRFFEAQP
jgi:hypothetical protein